MMKRIRSVFAISVRSATCVLLLVAAMFSLGLTQFAMAGSDGDVHQPWLPELQQKVVPLSVDSGFVQNRGLGSSVVYATEINIPGATWLRLQFADVMLAEGAQVRITSLLDGASQTMQEQHLHHWQLTTAYFNGGSIRVELIATPGSGPSRIRFGHAWAGSADEPVAQTICGSVDDRVLSDDPRSGRALPIGCTVFLIDDAGHCFLTAGHCSGSNLQVVQFNVPLSNSEGGLQHPGPEDQYAVDVSSKQFTNNGAGDDWGFFGCFPNTETNLTPFEAQGDAYIRAAAPPPVDGRDIRITGYGTDNTPPQHNQVQQTHAGPFFAINGNRIQYQTDTTGGNSGSGVQDDTTGLIIGIHTHGGCNQNGTGSNSGTAINHSALVDAMNNPRGVCVAGLAFEYPSGRPEIIDPAGGTMFNVVVSGLNGSEPQPGTGVLYINRGNGFEMFPMQENSDNNYTATFPSSTCGSIVAYYVTAETTEGNEVSDPGNAPVSTFNVLSAVSVSTFFEDDFENDFGWTVESINLTDGEWERGVPVNNGRGDPSADFDGSGRCYLTDNAAGNSDVDGGPTRLISPVLNLANQPGATLGYAWWFTNDDNDGDRLSVELSNDNGNTWVVAAEYGDNDNGWTPTSLLISDFVTPTATTRVRFSAIDNPNNSVTEAAIDAVTITTINCDTTQLTGVTVAAGRLVSGGLAEIARSDDAYLIVDSQFGFISSEPNIVDVRVAANTSNPTAATIDLLVESRVNNPGGTAKLRLYNNVKQRFNQVATYPISVSEEVFTISDVDATDRIDSNGDIRLSIRQIVVATFSTSGFRSRIDQVDIEAR
ncbi:MAG: hypothetical protein ACR2GY_01170 [Phycisphaerales bacterium]